MKIKASTTHVVLTTGRTPNNYSLWSEHKSEAAAIKRCNEMGRNAFEGHTVAIPVGKIAAYKTK